MTKLYCLLASTWYVEVTPFKRFILLIYITENENGTLYFVEENYKIYFEYNGVWMRDVTRYEPEVSVMINRDTIKQEKFDI